MTRCSLSGLEITTNPQWVSIHPSGKSSTTVQRIGHNIFHFSIDADESILLDHFENELLLKAIRDSSLDGKPFYVLWNLAKVKDLSSRYKRGISELILAKQPPLQLTIFYNIDPEFRPIAESIKALMPEHMALLLADSYADAIRILLDVTSGKLTSQQSDTDPEEEKRLLFLAETARIGWLNMLNQPINLPPDNDPHYPFFKALEELRKNLQEDEHERQRILQNFTQEQDEMLKSKQHQSEQEEIRKQTLLNDFEAQKEELTEQIKQHEKEVHRAISNFHEQRGKLRDLCALVSRSAMDTATKKQLIHTCDKLIETELNEKKIALPLTTTDSAFLSMLQKQHPDLNKRELKICLMIRLSYDTEDIARSIGITKRGMESIRYRMHKKIGLTKHQSIKNYLNELSDNQQQRT